MKDPTLIVTAGRRPEENFGIVNPPVFHASTILSATLDELDAKHEASARYEKGVFYGRRGTPTSAAFEEAVARLEGGDACLSYSSGLAAITSALLSFVEAGDHVLMVDSTYGPARRFCDTVLKRLGVETTYYDPLAGAGIAALFRPETRVVYMESPGSITFEVQDVPAITEAARAASRERERPIVTMIDNTWASPLFLKPFRLGVDLSIQAATKYVVGHSDAMLGTVTCTQAAWQPLATTTWTLGQCAGPDDLYLGQRGLRTIDVRMRRHWENGVRLAEWLRGRPEVARVIHPALEDDAGHALWRRDFLGASGLFSIVIHPVPRPALAAFVDGLELFGMGASWGGYESLVLPQRITRTATAWTDPGQILRFHAGLEDPDDLIADLEAGFRRLGAAL